METFFQAYEPLGVRIGRFWFKNRSVSPMPLFALMIVLTPDFDPSRLSLSLAIFVVLLAETLRIVAVGYAGSVTRTRGEKVPELVASGPFRYVRNPLYIANIVLYTATGLLFGFVG